MIHPERKVNIHKLNLSDEQYQLSMLPDFPWTRTLVKGICRWCGGPAKTPRSTWCGIKDDRYRGGWMMRCNLAVYQWWWQASSLRRAIFHRDKFICQKCGNAPIITLRTRIVPDLSELHMDHIIPIVKGGKTTWENLQTLCAHCNLSKGWKDDETLKTNRRDENPIT